MSPYDDYDDATNVNANMAESQKLSTPIEYWFIEKKLLVIELERLLLPSTTRTSIYRKFAALNNIYRTFDHSFVLPVVVVVDAIKFAFGSARAAARAEMLFVDLTHIPCTYK